MPHPEDLYAASYNANLARLEQLHKDAHEKYLDWSIVWNKRNENCRLNPGVVHLVADRNEAWTSKSYWSGFADGIARSINVLKGKG